MFSRSQTGSASQLADENGPGVFETDRVTSDRVDTQEKPSGTESRSSRKEWKGTRREELGGKGSMPGQERMLYFLAGWNGEQLTQPEVQPVAQEMFDRPIFQERGM